MPAAAEVAAATLKIGAKSAPTPTSPGPRLPPAVSRLVPPPRLEDLQRTCKILLFRLCSLCI